MVTCAGFRRLELDLSGVVLANIFQLICELDFELPVTEQA